MFFIAGKRALSPSSPQEPRVSSHQGLICFPKTTTTYDECEAQVLLVIDGIATLLSNMFDPHSGEIQTTEWTHEDLNKQFCFLVQTDDEYLSLHQTLPEFAQIPPERWVLTVVRKGNSFQLRPKKCFYTKERLPCHQFVSDHLKSPMSCTVKQEYQFIVSPWYLVRELDDINALYKMLAADVF